VRASSDWLAVGRRFRPDAEVVYDVGTGRRWTWAALHDDSLAWAAALRDRGVGEGDRVAVLAFNRGETLALLFAAAELGAILVPLNWRLSAGELAWQLDHCAPAALCCDAANRGLADAALAAAAARAPARLSLDDGPGCPPGPPGPGARLEQPWVMLYTSGSTGRPKGALLSHGQLHWNAVNTELACGIGADSATLTFAPLFHTGGLNCLTTPMLHCGGRVVLTPRLDPAEALRLVPAERITHLMGVPTIYQLLADHPDFDGAALGTVRDAICGGAPLGPALLRRYLDRGLPLRQGFGLTEVGPNCFSMPPDQVRAVMVEGVGAPGCVGKPIAHVAARLVRPDGQDCADGEPGELWLGGPAVCAGYWRDPAATAAAMGDGWFRTGDLLSRDAAGFFHVRGRLKEMFISGGENVYPAEVEAALLSLPEVAAAAVVGVPDPRWGEVGRAFVEARPGTAPEPAALLAALRGRLARFKLPKSLVLLPALPRTGSGKVDKPALTRLET
jgi:fatty-acyl-CoA synthase